MNSLERALDAFKPAHPENQRAPEQAKKTNRFTTDGVSESERVEVWSDLDGFFRFASNRHGPQKTRGLSKAEEVKNGTGL
jgi:hypothetical protein